MENCATRHKIHLSTGSLVSSFLIWPRAKYGHMFHFCSWVTEATWKYRKNEHTQNSFSVIPFCTQHVNFIRRLFSSEIFWYFTPAVSHHSSSHAAFIMYRSGLCGGSPWLSSVISFCCEFYYRLAFSPCSSSEMFLAAILCWTSSGLTKKKLKRLIRFWMFSWPPTLFMFLIIQIS